MPFSCPFATQVRLVITTDVLYSRFGPRPATGTDIICYCDPFWGSTTDWNKTVSVIYIIHQSFLIDILSVRHFWTEILKKPSWMLQISCGSQRIHTLVLSKFYIDFMFYHQLQEKLQILTGVTIWWISLHNSPPLAHAICELCMFFLP